MKRLSLCTAERLIGRESDLPGSQPEQRCSSGRDAVSRSSCACWHRMCRTDTDTLSEILGCWLLVQKAAHNAGLLVLLGQKRLPRPRRRRWAESISKRFRSGPSRRQPRSTDVLGRSPATHERLAVQLHGLGPTMRVTGGDSEVALTRGCQRGRHASRYAEKRIIWYYTEKRITNLYAEKRIARTEARIHGTSGSHRQATRQSSPTEAL